MTNDVEIPEQQRIRDAESKKRFGNSKYTPHQSTKEKSRRLKQLASGKLTFKGA